MSFGSKGVGLAVLKLLNEGLSVALSLLIAFLFGAGPLVDALFAVSFIAVLFARELSRLVRVALVPCLVEARERKADLAFGDAFRTYLLVAALAVGLGLFVLAPWTVRLLAPGFTLSTTAAAVRMLRILAPAVPAYLLFGWLQGHLHVRRRFYIPEAAEIAWKVTALAALLTAGRRYGVTAYAAGLSAAAFVRLMVVAVASPGEVRALTRISARGFDPRPLRPFALGIFVVFCSIMLRQMEQAIDRIVLSCMQPGDLTVFSLAGRLVQFGPFLLATSFLMPFLPEISRARARCGDVRRMTKQVALLLTAVGAPLGIVLFWAARDLVEFLLLHGKFERASVETAILAVRAFALGIPAVFCAQGLHGMFLIERNLPQVVRTGVAAILVHALALVALFRHGVAGVALAGSLTLWFSAAYLWARARGRTSGAVVFARARFFGGMAAAAAVLFVLPWTRLLPWIPIRVPVGAAVAVAVYAAAMWPAIRKMRSNLASVTAETTSRSVRNT